MTLETLLEEMVDSTVLVITFEDQQTVWCPMGEFFGTGYRIHPYQTWYTRVDEVGAMEAYWVMPFARTCTVALQNLGEFVLAAGVNRLEVTIVGRHPEAVPRHMFGIDYLLLEPVEE